MLSSRKHDHIYAISIIRVCTYQRGNLNPCIEEEQTTQWPKEKHKGTNNDLQNIHIKLRIE